MATFDTQLLGRTEKALNALLLRELAGTGLDEHRWITLTLTVTDSGNSSRSGGRPDLAGRVAGALQVERATAEARLGELALSGLVRAGDGEITATAAGVALHRRVVAATDRITTQLWGDLPQAELAAAGKILRTVLSRAETALAAG